MKKISQLIVILVLFQFSAFSQGDIKKGLLAYWSFDDHTAKDVSGNGHNGIIHGTPYKIYGIRGKAFGFDGVGDWIEIPSHPNLNMGKGKNFSISYWLKIDEYDNLYRGWERPIISKRKAGAGGSTDYIFFSNNKKFYFATSTKAEDSVAGWWGLDEPTDQTWHHIVGTVGYDTATKMYTKKYYLDDSLVNTVSGAVKGDTANSPMYIALSNLGGADVYFPGRLDELRMYNRELLKADVDLLYQDKTIGIDDVLKQNRITTYPNPTSGNLLLNFSATGANAHLQIKDITGKTVYENNINPTQTTQNIDATNLTNGVYIINIISSNGSWNGRFIKL
ncbi:MAG: T9SS type A sorting domain-containing protein [Bacteroidetes bacterium]|nr:T9SS type A sorting domain-containing protein [Bacteroidota bacterium]